jgi:hypothetical protein
MKASEMMERFCIVIPITGQLGIISGRIMMMMIMIIIIAQIIGTVQLYTSYHFSAFTNRG